MEEKKRWIGIRIAIMEVVAATIESSRRAETDRRTMPHPTPNRPSIRTNNTSNNKPLPPITRLPCMTTIVPFEQPSSSRPLSLSIRAQRKKPIHRPINSPDSF